MSEENQKGTRTFWEKIAGIPDVLKELFTHEVRNFLLFALGLVAVFILGNLFINSISADFINDRDKLAYGLMGITAMLGIICLAFSIDYSDDKKINIPALLRDIGLELIGASITFMLLSFVFL